LLKIPFNNNAERSGFMRQRNVNFCRQWKDSLQNVVCFATELPVNPNFQHVFLMKMTCFYLFFGKKRVKNDTF